MGARGRASAGTTHAIQAGVKIGGSFEVVKEGKASFLAERNAVFDSLYAAQQAKLDASAHDPIEVTLPNGTVVQGKANITTPYDVAKGISPGLAKDSVVARVSFPQSLVALFGDELPDPEEAVEEDDDDEEEVAEGDETAEIASRLWDMTRPLPGSCQLALLKFDSEDAKHVFWHSSAHMLGQAVEHEFGAYLTIGPALKKGFYYDFYVGDEVKINQDSYSVIEKSLAGIAKANQPFQRLVVSKADALEMFKHNPFKVAIISAKVPDNGATSCYRCGDLIDLCMGPHVPSTGFVKAAAIEKHSAAYWLGNAEGDSLQRVYGISFPDGKLLKEHIKFVEEAKKRDHRVLGNQMDLFFFEPQFSPGCCFWLPEGTRIYNKLCDFMRREYRARGFQEVITPNMFSSDLYKVSGHYQNYKDCMFSVDVEGKEWNLKPMNCPGHCVMFRHLNLSHKNMPLRLADFGVLHRNEFSGSLSGLTRVRRFCQDDAHIFCMMSQVKEEIEAALDFLFFVYKRIGFKVQLVLATRPKKALGTVEMWDRAESQLKQALDASGEKWILEKGDGAFYGPKIDIQLLDALDRWHQCGTIQLDFQLPLRFNLQYQIGEATAGAEPETGAAPSAAAATASGETPSKVLKETDALSPPDGMIHASPASVVSPSSDEGPSSKGKQLKDVAGSLESELKPFHARPVMIHRAILGSLERCTAVLLEHTGGKLPFWLSPRQAIILPISEKFHAYSSFVERQLNARGFDVKVDDSSRTINKKVREAQLAQWNYLLVVGQQEMESQTVTVRNRDDPNNQVVLSLSELVAKFNIEVDAGGRSVSQEVPKFMSD